MNLSARVIHASFRVTYVLRAKKELSIYRSLCEVRTELKKDLITESIIQQSTEGGKQKTDEISVSFV